MKIKLILIAVLLSIGIYCLSYYLSLNILDEKGVFNPWPSEGTRWLDIFRWLIPGLIIGYFAKSNLLANGLLLGVLSFIITLLFGKVILDQIKLEIVGVTSLMLLISELIQEVLKFMLATVLGWFIAQRSKMNL
ncbi:MAG: hypothetical protein HWD86_05880 [Kangiellaceae bacterium]|nr:hypothetical protein [Kangiellaceae bacterium]